MTFEEFIAACSSAQVVSTMDGDALLIGNKVIQFNGPPWAEWFAAALRQMPPQQTTPEVGSIVA